MSLECSFNAEFYVNVPEYLAPSVGTEFCIECKKLIPCGTPHYTIWEWQIYNDDETETHLGQHPCCEECGDLAVSFMELGYCWLYGDLRGDIKTMNA